MTAFSSLTWFPVLRPRGVTEFKGWGRLAALRKPDGGVRETVVSDFFGRVVARTVAQQFATTVEALTYFFSVLSTRAGTLHVLQTLTDLNARLDGAVTCWYWCVRRCIPELHVRALLETDVADRAIPFVRQFRDQASKRLVGR